MSMNPTWGQVNTTFKGNSGKEKRSMDSQRKEKKKRKLDNPISMAKRKKTQIKSLCQSPSC